MNLYVCHPLGGPNNASVPKTAWHRIVRESFPRDDHAVVTLEDKRVVAFLVNAKGLSLVNSCLSASEATNPKPHPTTNWLHGRMGRSGGNGSVWIETAGETLSTHVNTSFVLILAPRCHFL